MRLAFAILPLAAAPFAQNPATTVTVDAAANRHPINPNIYGIAYGDSYDMQTLNAPLNRWGRNSTTRYNWQIDAHSAAADWYFETYSDGNGTPSGSTEQFLATTRSANNRANGAAITVTGGSALPVMFFPVADSRHCRRRGYNVYRGTGAGAGGSTAIATSITTTSYTNTGLTNGTTYYYVVSATNSVGTSGKLNGSIGDAVGSADAGVQFVGDC
jgi:hypothetical protein